MTKIKIIKKEDGENSQKPANKKADPRAKKPRSLESTVQNWITERREKDEAEDQSRRSKIASWNKKPARSKAR